MDIIKLFDGTTFDIEDGAKLNHVVIQSNDPESVVAKFTAANLVHVEFWHGALLTGIYSNLSLMEFEAAEGEEAQENPYIDGNFAIVALREA